MSMRMDGELPVIPGLPVRLRITGRVGSGGQRTIYRAFDRERDREIAVICLERRADLPVDVARVQELHALARIRAHPNILELLDVIETDDFLLLCVPYLAQGDLARRLARSVDTPMPIVEALRIGVQLADALAHVHRHGLIHGDIKAENVLVADDGSVRLADFGLAHLGKVPAKAKLSGTPTHLAPERIRGDEADERSDFYSFGCLLYEIFSGRAPLSASSPSELLNLHLMARPRELQSRRPEVPIDVSHLIDRMLEKDPSARPRSALEIGGALSTALRAEAFLASDADLSATLPSRIESEAVLDRSLREARSGRPAIVLVTGEVGAGKSETLRRLGRRARAIGFGISVGVAQRQSAVPYAPLIDALTGLAGNLVDLDPEHADRLLDFLYLNGPHPAREQADRGATRERLFASVFAALNAASQRRPILLILEDLHDADEATLDLLTYLEYAIGERRPVRGLELLIAASCRSNCIPKRVDEMFQRIREGSVASSISLERLEERDLVPLLQVHGVDATARSLISGIDLASAGNALNAVEIVRLLRRMGAEGDPIARSNLPEWLARASLPLDPHGWAGRQLDGRSQECRQSLELAAILGMEFEPELVERLAQTLGIAIGAGLDEAVQSGIVVDRGGRLGFVHPLVREELSRRVPAERRALIHLKRVEALQAEEPASEERRDLEIAHHLIAAGAQCDPDELVEYTTRAGAHALARFAWAEAARYFDAAIRQIEHAGPSVPLAALHHRSGIAFFRLLDSVPCLRHLDIAAILYSEQGDVPMRARVIVDRARAVNWMGMMGTPEFVETRVELEHCLEKLGQSHRELRAEILAALAEQSWAMSDPARAEDLCLEALAATRPEVDHSLRAEISVILGLAQLSRLQQRAALSTWRFGALHGRRANDLSSTARCLQRVRMAQFVSGRLDEARSLSGELAAMNQILQSPSESAMADALSAATAVLSGDFDTAEEELSRGIQQLSRARYPWALAMMIPTRACARALSGNLSGALSALDELVESPIGSVFKLEFETLVERHRALVNYVVGDPIRFSRRQRQELIDQIQSGRHDESGLYQACIALELASAEQDVDLARSALPLVGEALESGWVFTTGWPFFLPRLVGTAKLLLGDVAGATEQLVAALTTTPIDELPIERGRVCFDLARAFALSPNAPDREDAVGFARDARDVLAAYPRNAFLERAQGLVRFLETRS